MRVVSSLLKRLVYPSLSRVGYLRERMGFSPSVVTYHGVLPAGYKSIDAQLDGNLVCADHLRQQIRFLKTHYDVISPQDFRDSWGGKYKLTPGAVLLTCDDGLRNHLTDMLPVLQEAAVQCLFFVTGASLEKTAAMLWHEQLYLQLLAAPEMIRLDLPEACVRDEARGLPAKRDVWWRLVKQLSVIEAKRRGETLERIRMQLGLRRSWDAQYRDDPVLKARFLTLNRDELRLIAKAGMTVGAHTCSHPRLFETPQEMVVGELLENRKELELVLGEPVWALAYPFGDLASVSAREIALAEQCGFTCAFVNHENGVGNERSQFALPRVNVTGEMSTAELEARMSGFHSSLKRLLA